jgi:UDP-N-acetylmuramate--alanine ligase
LPVNYLPGDPAVLDTLLQRRAAGDLVAFVGAGDIDQRARTWLQQQRQVTERVRQWDDQAAHAEVAVRTGLAGAARGTAGAEDNDASRRRGANLRGAGERGGPAGRRVRFARSAGIPLHVLGRGSNLLIPDRRRGRPGGIAAAARLGEF